MTKYPLVRNYWCEPKEIPETPAGEQYTIEELYGIERRTDGLYISRYGVSHQPFPWEKCWNIWKSFIGIGMDMTYSIDDAPVHPGQPGIYRVDEVAEIIEVCTSMEPKEALLKYGGHLKTCWQVLRDDRPFCTCGWNEVLQVLKR